VDVAKSEAPMRHRLMRRDREVYVRRCSGLCHDWAAVPTLGGKGFLASASILIPRFE
jgi:hypothetical protein